MKIKLKLTIRILFTLITFYFSFFTFHSFSQGIGINITGDSSNSKALLDIDAKNMSPKAGLLIPRMTTAERDAITTPIPESLLIYNTDTKCYEGYNATTATWVGFGCIGCTLPTAPSAGTNTPSQTEIIWNWNAVSGVTAYKWNTTNNYGTATDVGAVTSKTETSLSCNTAYTRYIWTYNNCGNSTATALTQTTSSCFSCGSPFSVTHTSGAVAPETKTVSYGTVTTSLSGASKCWITQNLGSTNQATSATDASDAAAGWYWQFNRKQGYKVGPTPAWTITSINETSDWLPANDPCSIELGTGWRVPTYTEWLTADGSPQNWANYNDTYNSVLKLHAAGFLIDNNGALSSRSVVGDYRSSTQSGTTNAYILDFLNTTSIITPSLKAYGFPVRCLKDNPPPTFTCGNALPVTHILGIGVAPETKTVSYGTVTTSLSGESKCWITRNLGATNQATSATDATEASAGWYWQFNRKQGYKHDGSARTPNTTWNSSISENSDWLAINDPCTLELGSAWRIPTLTEWTNADANGSWANPTDAYNSVLKLHNSGYLSPSDGTLDPRGNGGSNWSTMQGADTSAWDLNFYTGFCGLTNLSKSYGFSVRCIKD